MSIKLCYNDISIAAENAGKPLLKEEIDDILMIMNDELSRSNAQVMTQSLMNKLLEGARQVSRMAKKQAAIEKRNRMINAKRYIENRTRIINSPDPAKELAAILVGSLNEQKKSGGYSIDAQTLANGKLYIGMLADDLEGRGLAKLFQSDQLEELVYRELFDGFGVTENAQARGIAEAIRRVQKAALARKNMAGADIDDLPEYVVRQAHDSMLLSDAGYEQWKLDILPLLDAERTFRSLQPGEDQDKFLKAAWDNIVSGKFTRADQRVGIDGMPDPVTGFKGPANLAKKLSSERVLHFKDGASSYAYAKKYSRKPLSQAVTDALLHDGQNIALMETFGTNPKMMFERLLEETLEAAQSKGKKASVNILQNYFKELDGTTQMRGAQDGRFYGVDVAAVGSSFRKIQQMAKLGAATISSISDIATKAATINRVTDRNIFQSYHQALTDVFSTLSKSESKRVAYRLLTGVENFTGDVHGRFSSDDNAPGMISAMNRVFFKANGMVWWNNAQKVGLARMLATDLADYAKGEWRTLPKKQQDILSYFGITEQEFNLFRDVDMGAPDGRTYLFPDLAMKLEGARLDQVIRDQEGTLNITESMRNKFRSKLMTKIGSYYADMADTAVPTPGARERSFMNLGTMRGTAIGEALRLFMQLKGFPITYVSKTMMRQYQSYGGGMSGTMGIVGTMVGTTILGYMALSLKDIIKGREPRNPTDMKTFADAFVQGGGAGIYGDFIFGEFNRYGQGPLETFAGPTIGTASDVLKLYAKLRDGDPAGTAATRLVMQNTPFLNLFYTRAAMDYLFIYGIMEHNSPGYLRRMERRLEREKGQEFFFPPSQSATRF